jgi:hypothetical protein
MDRDRAEMHARIVADRYWAVGRQVDVLRYFRYSGAMAIPTGKYGLRVRPVDTRVKVPA